MTEQHPRHTAVIALGGNALSPAKHSTIYDQFRHTRESELVMRTALGASRSRIGQLLTTDRG